MNFRHISMPAGEFPSTSVHFLCGWENFRQLFVQLEDLQSTFRAAVGPSINFRQLSVWLGKLPSTFVNFLCGRKTIRQLL